MQEYTIQVNGKTQNIKVDSDTPLLWVLRDELNLVGTKYGCGIAQCGACTVHIDGKAVRSCILPINAVQDKTITTIEGLSEDGTHAVQESWIEHDVPQCGYCQSGQIMTAAAFLTENKQPTDEEIKTAMHGNICRCGTYNSINEAVRTASKKMN